MKLYEAIEQASVFAYEEDADQIVGRIDGKWQIAHNEDLGRQAEMKEPKFIVHSDGVDTRHIKDGEITEDWELPGE
jgi:hypothetical protein